MNMGIAPYNLASSLKIIIAQRLVRVLCNHCKKEDKISPDILLTEGFTEEEIKNIKLYAPVGCEHCVNGFKGRIGIFEVMRFQMKLPKLIMHEANVIDIVAQAKKEKIYSLREMGLKKVMQGITSLAELNRVFK